MLMTNSSYVLRKTLEEAQRSQKVMTIITINGFQLSGKIENFDDICLKVVDCKGKPHVTMFSAISTIEPRATSQDRIDYWEMSK